MAQQQQLTPEPQRYDEQTLRKVIQFADRLQTEHKERYSADDIEKIAAEIGVQPEFVQKALNEIEDKHDVQQKAEAVKKPAIPVVTVQVNQAMRQAGQEMQGTAKNFIQAVAQRLDAADVPQMKNYVGIWWSCGWALAPILAGIAKPLPLISENTGGGLGMLFYVGFGIYLSNRLETKRKEDKLT